jgi:DNA-directed RNA polymerase subunit RPC12/RpoP
MVQTPEEKKRRAKNSRLVNRYGITLEIFEAILESQGNMCPVCEETDKIFCVDHNHKTLKIRGIVCINCNLRVIGGARDQDWKLVNAAEYVTNHPADKAFPEGLYLLKNPPKTRRKRRATRRRRLN